MTVGSRSVFARFVYFPHKPARRALTITALTLDDDPVNLCLPAAS